MNNVDEMLLKLQEMLFNQHGFKIDVYYSEGQGAVCVPHNHPLRPQSVIATIPDFAIRFGNVG